MADALRLDPRRRGMLADMGIDVWILRGEVPGDVEDPQTQAIVVAEPVSPAEPKVPEPAPGAATLLEPAPGAAERVEEPAPREMTGEPPEAHAEIAVTCLTRPGALLLAFGREWTQAGRLGRDLLAAATGSWGVDPKRISFDWREPGEASDGWRAFKAFADKQLADAEASVIFVNQALVDHLPEGARSRTLVVLPEVAEFDTDAKRTLWTRIRNLER